LLVRLAREHGHQEGAGRTLGVSLTQQELATLVGATRQTVNDLLQEMVAVGLIERRGRELFLPHPAAIEAIGWPGDRSS
jgi:CRP/FNR family transcriptional regulator